MSAPFGYYEQSYPPELWETPQLVGATARSASEGFGAAETVGPVLTVSAGTPGTYEPDVPAAERPRNLAELAAVQLVDAAPWPRGSYVPTGTNGKRAHWTGTEWARGVSPGYPEPVGDELVGDGTGEALPEVDPSSYPPDAVDLEDNRP
jgi:hypothetical protein